MAAQVAAKVTVSAVDSGDGDCVGELKVEVVVAEEVAERLCEPAMGSDFLVNQIEAGRIYVTH